MANQERLNEAKEIVKIVLLVYLLLGIVLGVTCALKP